MENEQKTVSKSVLMNREHNAKFQEETEQRIEKLEEDKRKADQESKVVGNEITKKILSNHGVENVVTQDELEGNREQKSTEEKPDVVNRIDDSAVNKENEQVDNNQDDVSGITEADVEILEKAGITEESLAGKTFKEIKDMANDLNKEQVTSVENTQDLSKVVISNEEADRLALQFPFAKNLRGKTMDQVIEIIQNQNSYITTLEQQKKSDNQEVDSSNKQNSETEPFKLTGDDVTKLLDPTRNPDEVAEDLATIIQKAVEADRAKNQMDMEAVVKKAIPNIDKLQETANAQVREQFIGQIQQNLPEGIDAKEVFNQWKVANKNMPKEEKLALVQNPNLFIKTVSDDFNLKRISVEKKSIEETKDKEIKKQTYNNIRKLLKDSQKLGNATVFQFPREHSKSKNLGEQDGTESEKMVGSIIDKWMKKV